MTRMIAIALLCLSCHGLAQPVVIFGDSLSDEGRVYALMEELFPDPDFYYQGRFSNGPIWAEYAFPDRLNFAYGGALANHDNIFSSDFDDLLDNTGVFDQIDEYFAQSPDNIAETTFIIYVGPNDMLAMTDFDDPNTPSSIVEIVDNIEASVIRLKKAGATDITVIGMADLSLTPYVRHSASLFQQRVITRATIRFNKKLIDMADALDIHYFPADEVMEAIMADAAANGLINVSDACLTVVNGEGVVCDNPDAYLFWDNVHPTTFVHGLFARLYMNRSGLMP